jgi:hypothetical protein
MFAQGSKMKKTKWYFILALICLLAALVVLAWQQEWIFPSNSPYPASPLTEARFQRIPLAKPLSSYRSEISSMAWYGDILILVPQYPGFYDGQKSADGALFALSKESLAAYLNGEINGPLTPQMIPFSAPGLRQVIDDFDGFEGIAFHGEKMFLTIEASDRRGATGFLVSGQIAPDLSSASVDMTSIQPLEAQARRNNKSDETIFVAGDRVITLYEVNGARINTEPFGRVFTLDLQGPLRIPLPHIEYRITDATAPDEDGRFWVINVHWLGEPIYHSDDDPLAMQFGEGRSHARQENVERLLELQYTPQGIVHTGRPPIYIQLSPLRIPRNWEALARLDDDARNLHGFLIATDKYPGTVFAFIPDPEWK